MLVNTCCKNSSSHGDFGLDDQIKTVSRHVPFEKPKLSLSLKKSRFRLNQYKRIWIWIPNTMKNESGLPYITLQIQTISYEKYEMTSSKIVFI